MRAVLLCAALIAACSGSKKEPGTGSGTGTGTGVATGTATGVGAGTGKLITSGGPDAVVLPKIDRSADVKAFFVAWNAPGAVVKIHEAAHPRFQESVKQTELQIYHDDFTALMGRLLDVTSATSSRRQAPDGVVESMVFGEVMFEKGVVPYEIVFAEDANGANLKLVNLKMEVPKQYKPELDRA
ncbi:MAG TPA: hypothetical protein VM261_04995, partial [Kofleriaceae bacterium]|nr:hypothetical protein [Kofleriaceae bacterium]